MWTDVDFSGGCLSLQQLRRWSAFLRPTTRRLVLRGFKKRFAGTPRWKTPLISANFLKSLGEKCQELEELTLSEAFIDARKLRIIDFLPVKSIQKLSIVDCEFENLPSPVVDGSYFKRTHKILTHLQHLKITKCSWIDDYDLMVLSKIDTLKSLVLRNLPRVGRAMAYIALGFRFGFQNLEYLDLRGTSLEDNEVLSVVQNGKLRSLYLGPLGPVRRLPQESSREHNLVMPDPRWQEERRQVVVINVGPNGPHWRQVNDEELDGMGLQWVRNAPAVQRHQAEEEDEDEHYFIDRDGRPVGRDENNGAQAARNDGDDDDDDGGNDEEEPNAADEVPKKDHSGSPKPDAGEGSHQRTNSSGYGGETSKESNKGQGEESVSLKQKPDGGEGEEEEEDEDDVDGEERNEVDNLEGCYQPEANDAKDDHLQQEPYQLPDEGLSDNLVRAFGQNTKYLHTLVLSGCALTDNGLQDIIRLVPSLRYLDVTNTKVTSAGVQEARVARPECVILGGGTRVVRQNDR